MSIGTDIYTALSGDAGVSALTGDRIYPNWIPQEPTYPCMAYHSDGDQVENHLCGESGLAHYSYQFDVFAENYSDAQDLADAVRDALLAATTFKSIRLSQQDGYEPTTDTHSVSIDFSIWQ